MRNIPNKKADDNDDDESKYLNLELVDEDTLKEDRVVIGATNHHRNDHKYFDATLVAMEHRRKR